MRPVLGIPARIWLIRSALALLTLGTTAGAAGVFAALLWRRGTHLADSLLLTLFILLFLFVAFTFWTATFGFVHLLRRRWADRHAPQEPGPAPPAGPGPAHRELPRTALLMPIYNEDAVRSLAGLRAVFESLQQLGLEDRFDLFVLSDSNRPDTWLEEELTWAALRRSVRGGRIYYRRRRQNVARKAGNILDFLERWGGHYTYMVIFDADSVMSASTLLAMVRRMEQDPAIGILQAPPLPVNRDSVFARAQEFAASVYGEVYTVGQALWSQEDSNYWGHNAIIRVRPFVEHCGLPTLPGEAPLGGEILSHDFVEAALMRRAGWKVVVGTELAGSWEECPATLLDFARRNRRWCEGNLQHLRLLAVQGFHPVSRIHFGMGAMAYLSSVLWLFFLLVSFLRSASAEMGPPLFRLLEGSPGPRAFATGHEPAILFGGTMLLLVLPKLWGYLLLCTDERRLAAHGGALRAGASVVLETLLSVLVAPILMGFNTVFVLSALIGHQVQWSAQQRSERRTTLREAAAAYRVHTLLGALTALAIAWLAPALLAWMLPIYLGLVASIPLAMVLSSVAAGQWLRDRGMLLIEAESDAPPLLRRQRELAARMAGEAAAGAVDRFTQFVLDPVLHRLHVAILRASREGIEHGEREETLQRRALHQGPSGLSAADRLALLGDETALRWLHREAWSHWPLEILEEVATAARAGQEGR